jgi:hypothetical protein
MIVKQTNNAHERHRNRLQSHPVLLARINAKYTCKLTQTACERKPLGHCHRRLHGPPSRDNLAPTRVESPCSLPRGKHKPARYLKAIGPPSCAKLDKNTSAVSLPSLKASLP